MIIQILAIIGLAISLYLFYREKHLRVKSHKKHPDKKFSCKKALSSRYSHIFLIPNSFLGIIFYFLLFLFSFQKPFAIQLLSIIALSFTIVLSYFSIIKLKNFCPKIIALYLINLIVFFKVFWF